MWHYTHMFVLAYVCVCQLGVLQVVEVVVQLGEFQVVVVLVELRVFHVVLAVVLATYIVVTVVEVAVAAEVVGWW